MLQDPDGALSADTGSPEDQQNDVVREIWESGKPKIQEGEQPPWIPRPYHLAEGVRKQLMACLEGCSGAEENTAFTETAFTETRQEMENRLRIFYEASNYAVQQKPGRKAVESAAIGAPVTAAIPDDRDAYAAVSAARQHYPFNKALYNTEGSVLKELMKKAMNTVYEKTTLNDEYEKIALDATRLLEQMEEDPSVRRQRTLHDKHQRFELLTEWFKDFVFTQYYKRDEFDFLASFHIAIEMVLNQNSNLVAFLQGYDVMNDEGVMRAYDEWKQEPNFDLLKGRATSDRGVKFHRMSADAEKKVINNVANGAVDPEALWREIEKEKNSVATRLRRFLDFHLNCSDIDLTVEEVTCPKSFNQHLDQFENAYNLQHSKCGDLRKLRVNLYLAGVLQHYFLQLLIASQLIHICLELKMKLRGDHKNLEQIFKEICFTDPVDPDVGQNELRTLIGDAASDGPSMEFYTAALQQRKEKLSPPLAKMMEMLLSSQKTVLNLTLCEKGNPTTFLREQGLLQDGYLGPVAQVTGEVIATTFSRPDFERVLMGDAADDTAVGVAGAIGDPENPVQNTNNGTTNASSSGSDGGEGGTIDASDQTAPDPPGNMGVSNEDAEAGAPLPKEPEPLPRRLAPLPNTQGQRAANLIAAMGMPAATNEPPSVDLEQIGTILQDAVATDTVLQGVEGWTRFDQEDDIHPEEEANTIHATNNGRSRNFFTGANAVRRLMQNFQPS